MSLKKEHERFVSIVLAAIGLPGYLPEQAFSRKDGQTGISRGTLLTLQQEIEVKSAAERLVAFVLARQKRNLERVREFDKQKKRQLDRVVNSLDNGTVKLKENQLEVLAFIRWHEGEGLYKLARLFSQESKEASEDRREKFLLTVHLLESYKLIHFVGNGLSRVPKLNRSGVAQLSRYHNPKEVRFKKPATINDWRDLALATVMVCQKGDSYDLEQMVKDSKSQARDLGFDVSEMSTAEISNGLASGVLELKRFGDVEIRRSDGKEHIVLKESGSVPIATAEPPKATSHQPKPEEEESGEDEAFGNGGPELPIAAEVDKIIAEFL